MSYTKGEWEVHDERKKRRQNARVQGRILRRYPWFIQSPHNNYKEKTMSLADGMKNYETRISNGYCGICDKYTNALWERFDNRLHVSCEECGFILIDNNEKYKND